MGALIFFNCWYCCLYIDIVFRKVNFSNLKPKRMFLLVFKNSGKYLVNNLKRLVMTTSSKIKIYINNQTPLPKSMKTGYKKKSKLLNWQNHEV